MQSFLSWPHLYRCCCCCYPTSQSNAADAAGTSFSRAGGLLALGGADDVLAPAEEAPVPEAPAEAPHARAGAPEIFVYVEGEVGSVGGPGADGDLHPHLGTQQNKPMRCKRYSSKFGMVDEEGGHDERGGKKTKTNFGGVFDTYLWTKRTDEETISLDSSRQRTNGKWTKQNRRERQV